ncbi:conjugal transfer protein TraB [Streptomyces sp. NPDC046465]|uniref:conjugal transfer protein TraB n=1 Tax=Streptomyces sp. NPDC046465 TaxID=3155810 RepID=UPI0033D39D15
MSDAQAIEPTAVQTGAEAAATASAPPATVDAPAAPSRWSGLIHGIINFVTLTARITALVTAAILLKEGMHRLERRMNRNAATARRLAEYFSQAGVDPYHQGLALEASKAFNAAADDAAGVTEAADSMQARAQAVDDAHKTEYGGFYELSKSSRYNQPKPGFNKVP